MGWQLAEGTGYCEAGGELVFLDLVRDRYFALRGPDRAAFERLTCGAPNTCEAMTRLVASGLIARCEGRDRLAPTSVEVPQLDLGAESPGRSSLAMVLAATVALGWASRAARPGRLAATLAALGGGRSGMRRNDAQIEALARSFAAARILVPVAPRCLSDALALERLLARRSLAATLVFGIRLRPFAAHCWLQSAQAVLIGSAEEAANFTPILVV